LYNLYNYDWHKDWGIIQSVNVGSPN
jgi:hypothetical protein